MSRKVHTHFMCAFLCWLFYFRDKNLLIFRLFFFRTRVQLCAFVISFHSISHCLPFDDTASHLKSVTDHLYFIFMDTAAKVLCAYRLLDAFARCLL